MQLLHGRRHLVPNNPRKYFRSFTPAMTQRQRPEVIIRPFNDASQIPRLVQINRDATAPDLLTQWMDLYTGKSEPDGARANLEDLLKTQRSPSSNSASSADKYGAAIAVLRFPSEASSDGRTDRAEPVDDAGVSEGADGSVQAAMNGESETRPKELIAGFIYWFEGYLNVPALRGDDDKTKGVSGPEQGGLQPDAAQSTPHVTSTIANESKTNAGANSMTTPARTPSETQAARLALGEEMYAASRQHYIRTIKWRRHIFIRRVMVDPDCQRMGIGTALMRHVTAYADEKAMPCWLYSRPAGVKLYETEGFQTAGITVLETEELKGVRESRAMVRWEAGQGLEDW